MKSLLVDSHCHVDLYERPLEVAREAERAGIQTVAVTYLPSHYTLAKQHLKGFEFVRPALGLHPQVALQHERELPLFLELAKEADFIGEIGLDFSKNCVRTRAVQERSFAKVIQAISGRRRFVSLHSRKAESAVIDHLIAARMYPVVFHWFSGSSEQLSQVVNAGHYLSINTKMVKSKRWIQDIALIPQSRVLTETDGPFVLDGKTAVVPEDVSVVVSWLASAWAMSVKDALLQVSHNFSEITNFRG